MAKVYIVAEDYEPDEYWSGKTKILAVFDNMESALELRNGLVEIEAMTYEIELTEDDRKKMKDPRKAIELLDSKYYILEFKVQSGKEKPDA